MNNFKAKRVLRKLVKLLSCFTVILLLLVMLVVLRLYVLSKDDEENPQFTDGTLELHMIDVGQGDSFVLLQNDKIMLIDSGTRYNMDATNKALKELGVQKIDYLILTHFHQDHAAGLFSILFDYKVEHAYITDMSSYNPFKLDFFYYGISAILKTSNLFQDGQMLEYVKNDDGSFKSFYFEDSYVEFLAPIDDEYDIVNNYSLVAKITYGDVKMLFTGDIESEVEKQLLESGVDLSADIYKAAHHGSITSNTKEFLDAVNPSVVLISSDNGNHNTFGHPVESFMEYLQERNIMVYRTDELDTVTLVIDGESFTSDTSSGDYRSGRSIVGVE